MVPFASIKLVFILKGDLMKGIQDMYALVVSFTTVCIFLMLSCLLGWHTCSIDFSSAFVQANYSDEVWYHLPRGFQSNVIDGCLKLIPSLYSAKDAPKLWWNHINKAITSLRFKQSKYDLCIFYKLEILIILFLDDCGIGEKIPEFVDDLISSLQAKGFDLTREFTFAEFLGIQYKKDAKENVELTQTGLIAKIINATVMSKCKPSQVPARLEALGIDPEGEPISETWHYPSIT